ncbi:MAG: LysM peptidoglycan-binding domain-containing protein [Planctomycetota bacterium]|jgi:nucleoid-associated protein YgaU
MRTDIKLGVVIAMGAALLAGGYYMNRSEESQPVSMNGTSIADAAKSAPKTANGEELTGKNQARPSPTTGNAKQRPAAGNAGAQKQSAAKQKSAARQSHRNKATRNNATRKNARNNKPAGNAGKRQNASRQPVPSNQRSTAANTPKGKAPATNKTAANRNAAGSKKTTSGNQTKKGPEQGHATAAGNRQDAKGKTANPRANQVPKSTTLAGKSTNQDKNSRTFPSQQGNQGGATRPRSQQASRTGNASQARRNSKIADDTHKIQSGDSFASLAKSYYGSEKFTAFLIAANPEVTDPRRLAVGMSIRIPAPPVAQPTTEAADKERQATLASNPSIPAGSRSYKVRPGDTFYDIAEDQLGDATRWREVFDLNKAAVGNDPTRLKVGQVIVIPSS